MIKYRQIKLHIPLERSPRLKLIYLFQKCWFLSLISSWITLLCASQGLPEASHGLNAYSIPAPNIVYNSTVSVPMCLEWGYNTHVNCKKGLLQRVKAFLCVSGLGSSLYVKTMSVIQERQSIVRCAKKKYIVHLHRY